jgi:carboxyl-terminal processing protease
MLDETTGYIKLSKFSRTTYKEFSEAADKLQKQGMKRLIFDLRDNTGGYLDQALRLSNEFLEKGDGIVYMEGRYRPRQDYDADGRGTLKDVELSVLINDGSASSSEIFAGAIQDNDRGVIVGRRSFGKGLVQEPINFTDGSGIRLTVARFYTPSGRCIQKPYDKDYAYDIYERYAHGEMTSADSIKVDTTALYYTVRGRRVYGGGGIIPDVFVPVDTTRATDFYINCNRKTTHVRFASAIFDEHRAELSQIDNFDRLESYMASLDLEAKFLDYAARVDGIRPRKGEWEETKVYLMPQINALVGRYSKLDQEAFYRFYLPMDDILLKAIESSSKVF